MINLSRNAYNWSCVKYFLQRINDMFDYTKAENIGHDIITPLIRVSSAKFPGYCGWGFETWIFSKDPRQKNVQVWSDTEMGAKTKHKHIVNNLRKKYITQQPLCGSGADAPTPKPAMQASHSGKRCRK